MSSTSISRPVILCILDGWGWRPEASENAIALANTPVFDRLMTECPTAFLQTSGIDVGLPDKQMGNSEVGHLNMGAGRVVNQDILRIAAAIEDGTLGGRDKLATLISKMSDNNGTCHLMGLISPGGVHSHQEQYYIVHSCQRMFLHYRPAPYCDMWCNLSMHHSDHQY